MRKLAIVSWWRRFDLRARQAHDLGLRSQPTGVRAARRPIGGATPAKATAAHLTGSRIMAPATERS